MRKYLVVNGLSGIGCSELMSNERANRPTGDPRPGQADRDAPALQRYGKCAAFALHLQEGRWGAGVAELSLRQRTADIKK